MGGDRDADLVVIDVEPAALERAVALARTFRPRVLGLASPLAAAELVLSRRIDALVIAKELRDFDGEILCRRLRDRWGAQMPCTVLAVDHGAPHDPSVADAVLVRPYEGIDFARALAAAFERSARRGGVTLAPRATAQPRTRVL